MDFLLTCLSAIALASWTYLVLCRGYFWRADQKLDGPPGTLTDWPKIVAIVPARNEADVIGPAVASLLDQDYPGRLDVILTDDHSDDGTAGNAEAAAHAIDARTRLRVVRSRDLPPGWLGKPWALAEGLREANSALPDADYIWLSDADIRHQPENLRRMVAKAETDDLDLVSQMVILATRGFWARLLIPAFVFFFQKLYPFAWINEGRPGVSGSAGGCVLLRRSAVERIGGFAPIRGELIDDCALARAIRTRGRKGGGRLFLGLTTAARSLRPYAGLPGIWRMVARSAYTQLNHSPALLAGTLIGMTVIYLCAPAIALTYPWHGDWIAACLGIVTWLVMAQSFRPTQRLYGEPGWLALLLPLAGLAYTLMTFDSALGHWQGRGGVWKGRVAGGATLEGTGTAR